MSSPDPDRLEEQIRRALRTPELPDDGFTERVLGALPRRPRLWGVPQVLLALVWTATLGGVGLTLGILASSDEVARAATQLGESAAAHLANPWMLFSLAAALGSYGFSLYAARAAYRR